MIPLVERDGRGHGRTIIARGDAGWRPAGRRQDPLLRAADHRVPRRRRVRVDMPARARAGAADDQPAVVRPAVGREPGEEVALRREVRGRDVLGRELGRLGREVLVEEVERRLVVAVGAVRVRVRVRVKVRVRVRVGLGLGLAMSSSTMPRKMWSLLPSSSAWWAKSSQPKLAHAAAATRLARALGTKFCLRCVRMSSVNSTLVGVKP